MPSPYKSEKQQKHDDQRDTEFFAQITALDWENAIRTNKPKQVLSSICVEVRKTMREYGRFMKSRETIRLSKILVECYERSL
jgi:hypothetical protein